MSGGGEVWRHRVPQLAGVWLVGAVVLPAMVAGLPVLLLGGVGLLAVAALACTVLLVVFLAVLIHGTAPASVLGATGGRRAAWVALVLGFGTILWRLGWALTDEIGAGISGRPGLTALVGGVPFVLVAGVLQRQARWRFAAVAAFVGLAATGLVALRTSGPDELTLRLAYTPGLDRDTTFVVEVPGYRPSDDAYGGRLGTGDFLPEDPDDVPPVRQVTVVAYRSVDPDPVCGWDVVDSHLGGECVREPGGLVYRRAVQQHGYQVRHGDGAIVVSGTYGVDRELLRHAARTLRPASAALQDARDVFVADVPGYRGQPMGPPPGMSYEPADHMSGPRSVVLTLTAVRANVNAPCFQVRCTPEGGGLTYVRAEATHAYVLRRGAVDVQVTGGMAVDRALLRRAVLAARPATDEELLRALPPPPPDGPLDRLRTWLRAHP
ncbi:MULTISPECIES: hypothetical protein [Micromonospora]|uniref:hypothetical protein n=1 Tax=Micromonospora TaxID=1873 RepID=UPI001187670B|nr:MULTISPECIES: hypothetical protein [Micromonospora]